MYELGKKDQVPGAETLTPITNILMRPLIFPKLQEREKVICGFDQGLGERLIVCDSLAEMQELYDAYDNGYAARIFWYIGDDPGFIIAKQVN